MTDEFDLTQARQLAEECAARAEKATPGPWDNEHYYSTFRSNDGDPGLAQKIKDLPLGRCFLCANPNGEFVGTFKDTSGGECHIHRFKADDWRLIYASDGTCLVGMYDCEEGGVCTTEADAAFIASARQDVPALSAALAAACDEVERLTAERDALRQALAVYADRHNWFARPGEEYAISFSAKDDSWLTDHGGDLAATALRQARGEERS